MILAAEHISGTTDIVIPVLDMLPSFQVQMNGKPAGANRRLHPSSPGQQFLAGGFRAPNRL
jgi:hypothetical protein